MVKDVSMASKKTINTVSLYGSVLAFMAFAVYIFYVNQDVLYTAHERSLECPL